MRALLKKLTTDSAIYGVSNILGRFITFLLVPFYTNTLLKGDYGIVIVVYAYIAFLNGVFTFGLEPAYMRFVANARGEERDRIFSAALFFILLAGIALAALLLPLTPYMQGLIGHRVGWESILPLAILIVVLDAVNAIPFAALRMENRARSFATIKFVSIVLNVSLNVLFIAVLHMSIVSVFVSGVIASASSTLLLLPVITRRTRRGVDRALLRQMLKYGLPTMPGAVAIMLIEIIDKPILLLLTDAETVGVYGAAYKLGIFMMLVVSIFRYAWQPFYLQLTEDPGAKRLFARVMTYFVLLGSIIVLVLSLFIEDIVRLPLPGGRSLIAPEFWGGLGIVPIILVSYVFAGMDQVLNAGLYIQKRTMIILYTTAAGAAINVAANFLLIPILGMYGGAIATFASYFTIAVVYWVTGRSIYPIEWESARLLRIAFSLTIAALLWYLFPAASIMPLLLWKVLLVALFFVLLRATGFFSRQELDEMRKLATKTRPRMTIDD